MSKLKDKLLAVDMNDSQALSRMSALIEEARYKYVPVENLTIGDIVNEHYLKGTQFYVIKTEQRVNFERLDIFTLCNWNDRGQIGRKVLRSKEEFKEI